MTHSAVGTLLQHVKRLVASHTINFHQKWGRRPNVVTALTGNVAGIDFLQELCPDLLVTR